MKTTKRNRIGTSNESTDMHAPEYLKKNSAVHLTASYFTLYGCRAELVSFDQTAEYPQMKFRVVVISLLAEQARKAGSPPVYEATNPCPSVLRDRSSYVLL